MIPTVPEKNGAESDSNTAEENSIEKEKKRRKTPLKIKIEALDYFHAHGKRAFWKKYKGGFVI